MAPAQHPTASTPSNFPLQVPPAVLVEQPEGACDPFDDLRRPELNAWESEQAVLWENGGDVR